MLKCCERDFVIMLQFGNRPKRTWKIGQERQTCQISTNKRKISKKIPKKEVFRQQQAHYWPIEVEINANTMEKPTIGPMNVKLIPLHKLEKTKIVEIVLF